MTTHEVSRSTTGLLAALLNKITADSGHVAPGVNVFRAYRFTKLIFDPATRSLWFAEARDVQDWLDESETYADSHAEYFGEDEDRYGDR